MPWKADGDNLVIQDGNPVWVNTQGAESPISDVDSMVDELAKTKNGLAAANQEAKDRRLKNKDLEAELTKFQETFADLDPDEARKAINTVASLKDKDKEVAEKLAAQEKTLNEAHTTVVAEKDAALTKAQQSIHDLTVKAGFTGSEFLQKNTNLDADLAYAYLKHHFDVEEQDGSIVAIATFNGETLYSKDPQRAGKPADVNEALAILVRDKYPNLKEKYVLADNKPGSGKPPSSGGSPGGPPSNLADLQKQHATALQEKRFEDASAISRAMNAAKTG